MTLPPIPDDFLSDVVARPTMILAADVLYDEGADTATAASVCFPHWIAAVPVFEHVLNITPIPGEYEPGAFYKRELPCILALMRACPGPVETVIIDGYVDLAPGRPGLGWHLYTALDGVVVVGVAKTRFAGTNAIEVTRGDSKNPLFVTAAGISPEDAARLVQAMHGPFRIPTLLKRVDALTRGR